MLVLDPHSLSPDPCYGNSVPIGPDGWGRVDLYPVEVRRVSGTTPVPKELTRFTSPPKMTLRGDNGRTELLFDFGTELEAELEVSLDAPHAMNVYATFGESEPEAAGLGGYGQGQWCQVRHWLIPGQGLHKNSFPAVGFRFVRLQVHDLDKPAKLLDIVAHAMRVGKKQQGDFLCDDKSLQRLWQTSAYTARLCTRPDDLWDGIKRDRLGWYGDARITAMTYSATFFEPTPAAKMLSRLPADQWVNGIPNFSFDAVAMFRDLMLAYGRDIPLCRENLAKILAFLEWVNKTQINADGFIIRTSADLFFNFGFLDWSALPVGGRLEEQSWLQCKYLEALRGAAEICSWLGDEASAQRYGERAENLAKAIIRRFWSDGQGFHHTLRRVRPGYEKYGMGWGEASYNTDANLGPSGPSRHSTAAAAFAGLATPKNSPLMLDQLNRTDQPPVITPMFLYYEQEARARLGDPAGALQRMTAYLADMVENNDAATIWESFEPEFRDFRKWGLHGWPKSLCHGWGTGLVPLVQRWLIGLENLGPGWSRIRVRQPALDVAFSACVPTPFGTITVERQRGKPPVRKIPDDIKVESTE